MAAAVAILAVMPSALGEALVCAKTVEGMSRNPEMYSKLRTTMILGCALTETTAIYGLLIAILILFVG
jgi:F-type H+-transporting ATPase subunit c